MEARNVLRRLSGVIWTAIWKTEENLLNPGIRMNVFGNRIIRLQDGWTCRRKENGSRKAAGGRKTDSGRKTAPDRNEGSIPETGGSRISETECG